MLFWNSFFFCFFRTMLIKTLGVALLLFCVCAYKMKSLRIYRSRAPVRGLLSTRNTFAALFTLAAAQRALAHESFIFGARVRELLLFSLFLLFCVFYDFQLFFSFFFLLLFRVITRYFFSLCLHISHALAAFGRRKILKLFTLDTSPEQGWTQKFTLG